MSQHGAARERAFDELFRRPAPPSSAASASINSHTRPTSHHPPSQSTSYYAPQAQPQYRYGQQSLGAQSLGQGGGGGGGAGGYYAQSQSGYPDYASYTQPHQSYQQQQQQQQQQPGHYAQFGMASGGTGGTQGRSSVSSYRTSSDAGYAGAGPESTPAGSWNQNAHSSYSSAQAYADYGSYGHSFPPPASTASSAVTGYYPSSGSAADDPSPPAPPPGASRSYASASNSASARPAYAAPPMSSGPASASTSTTTSASSSLYPVQSSSSVSSLLPYSSYPDSDLASLATTGTPASSDPPTSAYSGGGGGGGAPPRLPEMISSGGAVDDFFGNWESSSAVGRGGAEGYADSSWRSSIIGGGGGGGATPTQAGYGMQGKRGSPASAVEVDGYGDGIGGYGDFPAPSSSSYTPQAAATYDRSRRSSADSDLRSIYPSQASVPTSLHPINASMVSLQSYPSHSPAAYLNSNGAAHPNLHSRKSSESMRILPFQLISSRTSPSGGGPYALPPDHRSFSFSSSERPPSDMLRNLAIGSGYGPEGNLPSSSPYGQSGAGRYAASQPHLPVTPRPSSHGSLPISHAPSLPTPTSSAASNPNAAKVAPTISNPHRSRTPVVYPALLSRVAFAFRSLLLLTPLSKDGLVYQSAFSGREAVDKIAHIIKTSDRNLALLLGRALDAQKFFHDVTYDHRLRDSVGEVYQFRERLMELEVPTVAGELGAGVVAPTAARANSGQASVASGVTSASSHLGAAVSSQAQGQPQQQHQQQQQAEEDELPSGVFTLLTDCYSPTCTRDRLCYSIACPRRLEQQARLNLKREGLNSGLEGVALDGKGGLRRRVSTESVTGLREPGSLWIHSVPQEISDSTSDTEKKRQEAINEVFYTERDFVRDLEYLRDSWIKPLRASPSIIPDPVRREDFLTQLFWNVLEIHSVNVRLSELLNKRQKQAHVVDHIGDIFLDVVPGFAPFVKYGAHQLYGKYEFEKEKGSNPAFAKFVEETERLPESRKLELNGYLTKPTTRLARYPLLLEACLKHTADENPDKVALPKVIKMVREFLQKVNVETGRSENRFNLQQLDRQLVFKNGEAVDLRLRDEDRELIFKGPLKKRGGTQSESAELQVFLFDHAVLMVKQKSKNEQYKVYRKPIPLELLVVAPVDDAATARGGVVRPRSLMARTSSTAPLPPPQLDQKNSKQGYALTFIHLGRRGYQITLWASTWTARKKWLDQIEERQNELRERSLVFETVPLSAGYFVGTNRLTCAAPFDNGNRMVYGTDNGVYLADLREKNKVPVKVISVPNVTQLDVLEEQGILIVLADKAVQTFFVDHLDPGDAIGAAKRARKISASATFFKAGQCLGRTLVCVVKSGNVSSTIKTLEPIDQARGGKKQPALRKFLQGSNESLRVFKEFYIPTESSSVHFLKSKLCVGCTKGFEIVDLETLDTQGLLDPADSSLDFVQKRENAKPIAIYRIEGEFLLCYDEFAFYVNKNGWRAKSNWIIQWEGFPTSFALHYPYVLAFEPTFIEVRHVESGALMQIIPGNNIRSLFADSPPSSSASSTYYQQQQQQQQYHPNSPAARYGSPYGGGGGGGGSNANSRVGSMAPPAPQPPSRSAIVVSDGDRAFSLVFNAPTDQ
ncbi:hypothetical protein JCM11641_000011 [Rhodosporidiobolus odoratus]